MDTREDIRQEIAYGVDSEGFGYYLLEYTSPSENVRACDPELYEQWVALRAAAQKIEYMLEDYMAAIRRMEELESPHDY